MERKWRHPKHAVNAGEALEKEGIPLLRVETYYGDDSGQLRTRINAFLEMVEK